MSRMEITKSDIQIYESIHGTIKTARTDVIKTVNQTMVLTYGEIGKHISEAIGDRADYGKYLLKYLSERLTKDFGAGFTVANLRNMRQFFQHTGVGASNKFFPLRVTFNYSECRKRQKYHG